MKTTDLEAAAQQALEALEWHYRQGHSNTLGGFRLKIDEKALRNLRAALAQEQAEPVEEPYCYVYEYDGVFGMHREFYPKTYNGQKPSRTVPVYTAQPQRKPLTDQEIDALPWNGSPRQFARAVERAHGIKENAND